MRTVKSAAFLIVVLGCLFTAPTTKATTTAAPGATTAAPGATTAAPGATTAAPGATTAAPGATTPSPGATTTAPSATTPPPATITPAQTTPSAVTTPPPGDVTTPPPPPITVTFTFQRNNQFTCRRPTTRCSSFGFCQRDTGRCFCVNGAYGLQCQIPGAIPQNGGACQTSNPCERGICYDNGLGARCVCPDGFYGGRCQHRMVYVQCHPNGMLVNVFPYGFSERLWYYRRPPTLSRCRIPTVAAFTARWPQFRSRGWRGYAGAYYHRNDPCGRNALVTETATTISYSRDLYIPYGNDDRHFTDTIIRITCNIPKTPPPPPSDQPTLPPAQVAYTVIDQTGQPVRGNVQRGTTIGLYFRVQPVPNSGGITDIRVNRCVITNGVNSIVIAENGCARPPIGRALLKPARGSNVLWISTADFPQGSLNWNFRCRVRTCTSTDLRCRLPFSCETRRKRRAIRRRTEDDENTVVVSSHFTFAN